MGNFFEQGGAGQVTGAVGGAVQGAQVGSALGPYGAIIGGVVGAAGGFFGAGGGGGITGSQEGFLLSTWGTSDQRTIRDRLCALQVPNCETISLTLPLAAYGITAAQAAGTQLGTSVFAPGGQTFAPAGTGATGPGFPGFFPAAATPPVTQVGYVSGAVKALEWIGAALGAWELMNLLRGGSNSAAPPTTPGTAPASARGVWKGGKTVRLKNGRIVPHWMCEAYRFARCNDIKTKRDYINYFPDLKGTMWKWPGGASDKAFWQKHCMKRRGGGGGYSRSSCCPTKTIRYRCCG